MFPPRPWFQRPSRLAQIKFLVWPQEFHPQHSKHQKELNDRGLRKDSTKPLVNLGFQIGAKESKIQSALPFAIHRWQSRIEFL